MANDKHFMGNDKDGKPVYADAWYVEPQKDGSEKRYPAVIEREFDSTLRMWTGENSQARHTVKLADVRVDFGTTVVRATPAGVMKAQPEYKSIHGVARRGASINPTNRKYYERIGATPEEIQAMDDGAKSAEQLLIELKALRAAKGAPAAEKADIFGPMSDSDIRAHAKSVGATIAKDASRADIIKAIKAKESE